MYTYDIFISFRHIDARWDARKIRSWLQKFRLPKDIPAQKTEELRIYVDTFQKRVTADYWEDNIKPALEQSEYLIVIASPMANTPLSDGAPNWVTREIETFLDTPQRKNIIPIVTKKNKNKIIPNLILKAFPKIQIIDLGSTDKFIPTIPFFESAANLELLRVIIAIRGINEANTQHLFNEEKRRAIKRLTVASISVFLLLSAVTVSGILAFVNSLEVTRLAANSDINKALELSLNKPDKAKLFATRALNTVNRSWTKRLFLTEANQRIRHILQQIQLPDSIIQWPGGRIDKMLISDDYSQVIVLTENEYLAVYRTEDLTPIYTLKVPCDFFKLKIVSIHNEVIFWCDQLIYKLNKSGEYIVQHAFDSAENVYLLDDGNLLHWSDLEQYIRYLDLSSLREISTIKTITESFISAKLIKEYNRIIINFETDEHDIHKLQIFDIRTGEAVENDTKLIRYGFEPVVDIVNGLLFVLNTDGKIERINLRNGKSDLILPSNFGLDIGKMWISPNGRFALVERSNQMEIWDMSKEEFSLLMPPIFPSEGRWAEPLFSVSGRLVAIALEDKIRIVDLIQKEIRTLNSDNYSQMLAWSSDDNLLAATDLSGRVVVSNLGDETFLTGIKHHEGMVKLVFTQYGLISSGWDGSIRLSKIFETASKPKFKIGIPKMNRTRGIPTIDINEKNNLLAIQTEDDMVSICSLLSGECNWSSYEPEDVSNISFIGSGNLILVAMSESNQFRVRKTKDGGEVLPLIEASAVIASPVSEELFIISTNNRAQVIDAITGNQICNINELFHDVQNISYSTDGKYVMIINISGQGSLLDTNQCHVVWQKELRITQAMAISFSYDSELFAVGGAFGAAVFKLSDGSPFDFDIEDRHVIRNLAFHPNKPILLTVGMSRRLNLYDLEKKLNVFPTIELDAIPWTLSFDPSGDRFAVGLFTNASYKYNVRVFDTSTGFIIGNPLSHYLDVYNVQFLENESTLISSDASGVVFNWDLGPDNRSVDDILKEIAMRTGQTINLESGVIHQLSIGGYLSSSNN